jgi:hypothetical protein
MKTGLTYSEKRQVVSVRRLVRKGAELLNARLAVLLSATVTARAITDIVDQFLERDLPVLVYWILRRAGLQIAPGDPLTPEGITAVVSRQTGVEFRDLTDIQKTREDIERAAAKRLEEASGLIVERFTRENLIKSAKQLAVQIVKNEAPGALGILGFGSQAQKVAKDAYREGGTDSLRRPWSEHLRRWNHREAQRRYDANHSQVWEWGHLGRTTNRGRFRRYVYEKELKKWWRKNKRQWRRMKKGLPTDGEIRWYSQPSPQFNGRIQRGNQALISLVELNRERARSKRWR